MEGFEFDPDVIGGLPARLTSRGAEVAGASTLPSPDAGAATADVRSAIVHLEALGASVNSSLDGLASGITACAKSYAGADGDVSFMMDLSLGMVL